MRAFGVSLAWRVSCMVCTPYYLRLGGHRRAPDIVNTCLCDSVHPSSTLGSSSVRRLCLSSRRPLEGAPAIAQHTAMSVGAMRRARDDRWRHSSSISLMQITKSVTRRKRTRGLLREATLRLVLCTKSGTWSRLAACHGRGRSGAQCHECGTPRRRRQGAVGHARKLVGSKRGR